MPFTNSPNMGMPIPQVGQEPGPQYASDVNQCLQTLDAHGHGPGAGNAPPIGSLGINILSDLSFNIQNAVALRTVRFVSTTASSGTDIGCVYVRGVDLFYNDLNGNVVRVTQNGGLSSTGLFTGVISTTAIISAAGPTPATSGFIRMNNNTDFVSWRNAGNNADNNVYFDASDNFIIRGGLGTGPRANNFQLSDTEGSGKIITFQAPLGSSAYKFTPPAQPSTALSPVFFSTSGNLVAGQPINFNLGMGANIGAKNIIVSQSSAITSLGIVRARVSFTTDGSSQIAAITGTTGEGVVAGVIGSGTNYIALYFSPAFVDVPVVTVTTEGNASFGSGDWPNLQLPTASTGCFPGMFLPQAATAYRLNIIAIGKRSNNL